MTLLLLLDGLVYFEIHQNFPGDVYYMSKTHPRVLSECLSIGTGLSLIMVEITNHSINILYTLSASSWTKSPIFFKMTDTYAWRKVNIREAHYEYIASNCDQIHVARAIPIIHLYNSANTNSRSTLSKRGIDFIIKRSIPPRQLPLRPPSNLSSIIGPNVFLNSK